jgi:hypothetical protein
VLDDLFQHTIREHDVLGRDRWSFHECRAGLSAVLGGLEGQHLTAQHAALDHCSPQGLEKASHHCVVGAHDLDGCGRPAVLRCGGTLCQHDRHSLETQQPNAQRHHSCARARTGGSLGVIDRAGCIARVGAGDPLGQPLMMSLVPTGDADEAPLAIRRQCVQRDIRVDQAVVGDVLHDDRYLRRVSSQVVADDVSQRCPGGRRLTGGQLVDSNEVLGNRAHQLAIVITQHGTDSSTPARSAELFLHAIGVTGDLDEDARGTCCERVPGSVACGGWERCTTAIPGCPSTSRTALSRT